MAVFAAASALTRAIADCTQPHGSTGRSISQDGPMAAPASAAAFLLQGYLADPRTVDTVYQGLMQRAWAQPLSVGIIERVIAIVRQHVVMHTPSPAVLQQLRRFCEKVPTAVVLSAASLRSLQYVQSMLSKWLGPSAQPGTARPSSAPPGGGEDKRLAPQPTAASQSGTHSSWALLLPDTNGFVTSPAADATGAGSSPEAAPLAVPTLLQGVLGLQGTSVGQQLAEVVQAMQQEAQHTVEPVAPAGAHLHARAQRDAAVGTSRLLFQVLPYSRQEELAGSGTLSGTSGGGSIGDGRRSYPAASSSGMVSGEDVALVVEVVLGPAAAWAAGLSPSPSSAQPSAAGGRAGAVGADAEIKVVADGIAAGELKAGRGSEEATQAEDVAGYWESQYDVDGFGQVCSSVLIKLVMDLYLKAGPSTSYPLVLRMLHRALARRSHSTTPQPAPGQHEGVERQHDAGRGAAPGVGSDRGAATPGEAGRKATAAAPVPAWRARARVFDLLYNLAVHAPLLYGAAGTGDDGASGDSSGGGDSGGGGSAPQSGGGSSVTRVERFRVWLRALFFPLLVQLQQGGEQQEGVWASALGCLLQLTTHGGRFAESAVQHLPVQAASGLLHACTTFGWSQELYCHLLHLYCRTCRRVADQASGSLPSALQSPLGSTDRQAIVRELVAHMARAPTSVARLDVQEALMAVVACTEQERHALAAYCAALGSEAVAAAAQAAARAPLAGVAERLLEAVATAYPDLAEQQALGHEALGRLLAAVQAVAAEGAEQGADAIAQQLQATLASISGKDSGEEGSAQVQKAWHLLKDLASGTREADQKLATHWLHLLLSAAFAACQANLLALSPLSLKAAPSTSWRQQLADVLLHLVRVAPKGSILLQQATFLAVAKLQCPLPALAGQPEQHTNPGGDLDLQAVTQRSMQALHVMLMWLLQSGDSQHARARSQPAINALADRVLECVSCPAAPQAMRSGAGVGCLSPLPPAGALLAGHWGLRAQVVQATPPELLVLLLQQTSPPGSVGSKRNPTYPCSAPRLASIHRLAASLDADTALSQDSPITFSDTDSPRHPGQHGSDAAAASLQGTCVLGDPASERRAALLLVLLARCGTDADAFAKHSLAHVLKEQLQQGGPRERYLAGAYLLQHWAQNQPHKHWRLLRQLVVQAAHANEEQLLHNPYFKIGAMMACEEGKEML